MNVTKQRDFLRGELQEQTNDGVREVEDKSIHEKTWMEGGSGERKQNFTNLSLLEIMEFRSFTD